MFQKRNRTGFAKMAIQCDFLLAGLVGFEHTHDGVKVRCLTAWLQPIICDTHQNK